VRTVPVQVIRHACAVDKRRWAGPDRDRPLDEIGFRQAEVLAKHFARLPSRRIVSSPARRCVQTVEPLAEHLGRVVETAEELNRDGDPGFLLALAVSLDVDAGVICAHGELMRPLLEEFRSMGTRIRSARADDEWLLSKGTVWTLTLGAAGRIVEVAHLVPPKLPLCPDHAMGRDPGA